MKATFTEILKELAPTEAEDEVFGRHRKSLTKLLKNAGATQVIPIGSRRRGTALKDISDYDLIVLFPRKLLFRAGRVVSSTAALNRIREAVASRYPQTAIRTDKQAIVVTFQSTGASIDLVPGYFAEPGADFDPPARNYPVYGIPNGSGSWILSSPHAYDALLAEADKKSGQKLRKVSQLLKYWTHCYTPPLPLSSFAYEMLLVQTDVCRPGRPYGHCLWTAFKLLSSRDAYRIDDPLQLSGAINLARTPRQASLIRRRARLARIAARKAVRERHAEEASDSWKRVFNGAVIGVEGRLSPPTLTLGR